MINAIAEARKQVSLVDGARDSKLRKHGITGAQYEAMKVLHLQGVMESGKLALEVGCSRGNVTGILDRLERDGWIDRTRSKGDRRVVNITLTNRKFESIYKEIESWETSLGTLEEAVTAIGAAS